MSRSRKPMVEKQQRRNSKPKQYDVDMIRSFLDHLLCELRVLHFETISARDRVLTTDDLDYLSSPVISPQILEQLRKFNAAYRTILLTADVVDTEGLSQEETLAGLRRVFDDTIERRDAQIGHLEALQDLFHEALTNAASKDRDQNGHPIPPVFRHKLRPAPK